MASTRIDHPPTSDTADDEPTRQRPGWVVALVVAGAIGLAVALALFQPWLLFVDTEVDEQLPTTSAAPTDVPADSGDTPADDTVDGDARGDAATGADGEPGADGESSADSESGADGTEAGDGTDGASGGAVTDEAPAAGDTNGATDSDDAPPSSTAEPAEPVVLATGEFVSRDHETVGTASLVRLEDGSRVVTLEDFRTSNGPDLYVYLDDDPSDAEPLAFDDGLDLGALRGNVGNLVYEVPADADLTGLDTVVIWCDRFSHVFGAADLSPA